MVVAVVVVVVVVVVAVAVAVAVAGAAAVAAAAASEGEGLVGAPRPLKLNRGSLKPPAYACLKPLSLVCLAVSVLDTRITLCSPLFPKTLCCVLRPQRLLQQGQQAFLLQKSWDLECRFGWRRLGFRVQGSFGRLGFRERGFCPQHSERSAPCRPQILTPKASNPKQRP